MGRLSFKTFFMYYNLNKMAAIFESLCRKESKWTVFNSILDFTLIAYRYHPTGEALQAAHQQLTTWPEKEAITSFLTEMTDLQPEGFGDPLGEFYMMHISYGHLGQYFTPEPITDMLAHMNIGDNPQPGQTVLDPACGSGRTLLAAAKINRHLRFYGADLDATCCKMALINMLLNSLTGEIAHMNSLTNEFYRGYHCQTKLINGYHHPYFVEFTDPNESRIWLRPPVQSEGPSDNVPASTEKPFDPKPAPLANQPLTQGSLF